MKSIAKELIKSFNKDNNDFDRERIRQHKITCETILRERVWRGIEDRDLQEYLQDEIKLIDKAKIL